MKRIVSIFLAAALLLSLCGTVSLAEEEVSMTFSDNAINILKKIEGFSPRPYWDVSQYTVGYGTYCPDELYKKFEDDPNKVITEEEALALLNEQLNSFVNAVNSFAVEHNLTLAQNQFDALVMFSYNCGTSWTKESTGYFYNAVKNQVTGTDFIYAICLWSSAGGQFILTKRRMSEANMYLNNVYEAYNDTEDGTYPDTYKYVFMDGNGGRVNYTMHGYDATDNSLIITEVTPPTGIDMNGQIITYTFDGWYTASTGGTKVETLDGTLPDGTILYAQWKDPDGNIIEIPRGNPCTIKVTTAYTLHIMTGPGTDYQETTSTIPAGQTFTLSEIYHDGEIYWGKYENGWVSLGTLWPKQGSVTGDKVNIRKGPGTSYHTDGFKIQDDSVEIFELTYAEGLNWGRLNDGNWICMDYVHILLTSAVSISGDINDDGTVNEDDAIYLLQHILLPDIFPLVTNKNVDYVHDGNTNEDDAIYLLQHVLLPDIFPIS